MGVRGSRQVIATRRGFLVSLFFSGTLRSMTLNRYGYLSPTRVSSSQFGH